jgi:MoxR-like ATPase
MWKRSSALLEETEPMAAEGIARNVLTQVGEISQSVVREVSKVYIGAPQITEALLTALLARGHVLIEGVPGVAKTTLVKAFSKTLGCSYRRIQFTPDLLPSDITGTYILDMRTNEFQLREGPIFTNVLLGDEINRAPAKTQSALLEAMAEYQVTIEGQTRTLEKPFIVLATQNPIEHEGTYPLPEAQVDRFLIKLVMTYPQQSDEKRMLATYNRPVPELSALLSPEDVLRMQQLASEVHVAEEIFDYILGLVGHTRQHRRVYLGASPRAALALLEASKALALIRGHDFVLPDHVRDLAPLVLPHRIIMTPDAELEGIHALSVVREAIEQVTYKNPRHVDRFAE